MPDRPTKKERRDAARIARREAQRRAQRARARKRVVGGLVGVVVVALIFGLFALQSAGNKAKVADLNTLASDLGCTELASFPSMGQEHIGDGETGTYDRLPPDSGNHFGSGTSPTGALAGSPPNENFVHNLEHGQVGLLYRPGIDASLVTALETVAKSDSSWVIAAPYDQMPEGRDISMVAWRNRVDCPSADGMDSGKLEDAAGKFVTARKSSAPESVPGQPG